MVSSSSRSAVAAEADAGAHGIYHFLDVGGLKYGECTLVRFGEVTVLIDGSHEKDFVGQDGYESVPEQLRQIFRRNPPYHISLMVVTHCHADHIGCLPQLVSEGVIEPDYALITDHKLGFGRSRDDDNAADLADDRTRALAAVLREEDVSDLTDGELQEFIDAVEKVETKYARMIGKLRDKNVKVVEYRGQQLPEELRRLMQPTGMTLLGPSRDQLVLAARQIAETNDDAADAVRSALAEDADLSNVALYRRLINLDNFDDVRNPRGSGMNCQSITLAFGPPNARVLLAGDMQFADPNVRDAEDEVAALRRRVQAAGPYRVFKTTHHTSHNGQDEDFLAELGNPTIIVHSGGLNDATHPDPGTLTMLKQLRRSRSITFARTDRNGLITVRPHLTSERAVEPSRGRLNNFTPNGEDIMVPEEAAPELAPEPVRPEERAAPQRGAQVIIINLPDGPVDLQVGGVDIVQRALTSASSTPLVIENQPPDGRNPPRRPPEIVLAGGRELPRLLFVTNSERLAKNIGKAETEAALRAIHKAGKPLLDIAAAPGDAARSVRNVLRSDQNIVGVVIAGGYDVVAAPIVDVLSKQLRDALGEVADDEPDRFVVWSDEPFGDTDGDHTAERPVSRIPDARDATLFLTALQAKATRPAQRFGIRNYARPFAETVWPDVTGDGALEVSAEFLSSGVSAAHTASTCQYFMLHGNDSDARVFTGESDAGAYTRAFAVDRVPRSFEGIVFSGCCWGALTVSSKAVDTPPNQLPAPRVAERSIALSYLKAGANAFVGCTGAHYSGWDTDPEDNYATVFHSAFWKLLPRLGYSASRALQEARMHYGKFIAGLQQQEPIHVARRLKNRAQFTCLGLGW